MAKPNLQLQTEDIVRFPLIDTYNTRNIDSSAFSSGASGVVGLLIVGIGYVGATSLSIKDQKYVNCFPEKVTNKITGKVKTYVTKRPGFAVLNTPSTGNVGSAIKVWSVNSDKVISAFGAVTSTIYDGTSSLGDITGKAYAIEETKIGATPYVVIMSENNTAWYSTGAAPSQITDGQYPGNDSRTVIGKPVFVDGYMFVMDNTGRIYNSDLNSVTAWTQDSYITANMYPDAGIGLARFKNLVVALGKNTIEFFYINAANTVGTPLSRYEQGFINFGCISQHGYVQLEDTIAWVSASDRSGIGLYVLDGLQPKRVSIPSIDTQLSLVDTSSVFLSAGKFFGKTWIILVNSSTTFVYCLEDDMWHEWGGQNVVWHHLTGTTSGTRLNYSLSRTNTTGQVYVVNPSALTYADDGTTFTMQLQTQKFDGETINHKFLNKLSVVGDQSDSANTLTIQWSDDDYQTWSTARTVDLNDNNPYLMNCGKFKRRAFKLTNSVNEAVRLEALEFQLKQGIH